MKRLLPTMLLFLLAATGCERRPTYGATSSWSYGDADHKTTNVMTQRDAQQKLLFAIAWTADRGGWSAANSGQNLITSIDGHPVHPNLQRRALYALQPDRTLREIPLSETDLTTLFNEMNDEGFRPSGSELWQKQVAPKLADVEPTGHEQPT